MKKNLFFIKILILLFFVSSCTTDDESSGVWEFVAAFENPSVNFSDEKNKEIKIVFSRSAPEKGTLTVSYETDNAIYGPDSDFTTVPSGKGGIITVPFNLDDDSTSFTFNKLKSIIEGKGFTKGVTFKLENISISESTIKGNTSLAVSFTPTAALGGVISPEVGGPAQPNQVFVDLSSQKQTKVKKDSWNLGFYNGEEFRVTLNGAIYMRAAKSTFTDINAVSESKTDIIELKKNIKLIDRATGDITETAIDEISENDEENKVYLLEITGATPRPGSETKGGGLKKIRILRKGNDYELRYADINDTTFKSVTISKNTDYNFTCFSFDEGKVVTVAPEKEKWDLKFTVFTNQIGKDGRYPYSFADFVVTNLKGGAISYKVRRTDDSAIDDLKDDFKDDFKSDVTYDDFKLTDVNNESFTKNKGDQRRIGKFWRNVFKRKCK